MSQYSRNNPEEPIQHDWLAGTRVRRTQQPSAAPLCSAHASVGPLEQNPAKLTLAAQVERLEFQAAQLNEMLGETIATILVNLDRKNILCCDAEAEKNLRAFMDSHSKWREQLMCPK